MKTLKTQPSKKIASKRLLGAAAVLFVLLTIVLPNLSHAAIGLQERDSAGAEDSDCGFSLINCAIQGLLNFIFFVAHVVLAIGAWALEIILKANQELFNTPAVQVGFNVTLSIANLGFVLAIVIIAIMTILRSQTYGIKQTLWRLIVAAFLVNFSLVFAGAIVNFADQFTSYFMNTSGGGSTGQFVLNLTSGLQPSAITGTQALPGGFTGFMQQIASLLLAVLITAIIIITIFGFVVMMLIRYVTLGILLILMPLAWLLWIFPKTRAQWSKWWNTFLRWTFFAPIMMFFVYLAIVTWANKDSFVNKRITQELAKDPKSSFAALNDSDAFDFLQRFFLNFADYVGQQMIIIGLLVGGLYSANKFSITAAEGFYGAALGAAKGFGNYVKRGGPAATAARFAARGAGALLSAPPSPKPGSPLSFRERLNTRLMFAARRGGVKGEIAKGLLAYGDNYDRWIPPGPSLLRTVYNSVSKIRAGGGPVAAEMAAGAFGRNVGGGKGLLGSIYEGAMKGAKKGGGAKKSKAKDLRDRGLSQAAIEEMIRKGLAEEEEETEAAGGTPAGGTPPAGPGAGGTPAGGGGGTSPSSPSFTLPTPPPFKFPPPPPPPTGKGRVTP